MTVYTDTARFDTGRAMTEDEMRKVAPSIFAVTAHESRSERFKAIPTIDLLRALTKEGFVPVGAKQSRSRIEGKAEFTKHLIRLRRIDDGKSYSVGDNVCEILLKNANDGTSAYELMAGLFRIRCLNSLVAQVGTLEAIKVRHSGDVAGKVIEGTYTVLNEAEKVLAAPQDWSGIKLNCEEQAIFANAAHMLRFGDADGETSTSIKPEQLLIPRRYDDKANDLWTTFNVIQENTIKGGLRGVSRDEFGRPRRAKSRAVNGIDQDIKLNKALWTLSQRMAELKA
ncbi:DUF932 domain-containing protein [Brucella rhizosphaerae]|uniref:DUF945 domain-containing protein n=1 Tax=Brucella rhizosphaerae TaxID=571254 RepID=A0A256FYU3_9HYPH|nr:DUF932 domain-containing protein [Brucella rhizosphaerae]OYR19601.1 hypothetical protein CEV32_4915 [Brucella rhizosphaerae]